ncbi:MAG TPA: hypothetical protein DIW24_07530 [Bacteroidetes bacterium]|nr:hypothetical protein [Bacteroidota bacterium]
MSVFTKRFGAQENLPDGLTRVTMSTIQLNLSDRLSPGTCVGRFVVGQWLASGGTADIYGCYPASDSPSSSVEAYRYVIKLFRFQGDAEQYDRRVRLFEKEVSTLRGLAGNIHIINVLEHGEYVSKANATGRPFCVLPLMSGGTLTSLIHHTQLSADQTVNIALGLVDALQFAHHRAILHCDIKPDNVMLDDSLNPIWIDFGIAKEIDTRTDVVSVMSEVGNVAVGTAPYMSPEHFAGRHALCPQSDLWSMGVLMVRMLTRTYPFGMHFEQVRQRTLIQRWEALGQLPAFKDSGLPVEISNEVQAVLLKCLQVELEDRYQTAAELKADLLALQQHRIPSYALPEQAAVAETESMTMEVTMPLEPDQGASRLTEKETPQGKKLLRWFGLGLLIMGASFGSAMMANRFFGNSPSELNNTQTGDPKSASINSLRPEQASNDTTPLANRNVPPDNPTAMPRMDPGNLVRISPANPTLGPNTNSTQPAKGPANSTPQANTPPPEKVMVTFVPNVNYDASKSVINHKSYNPSTGMVKPFEYHIGQTVEWSIVGNGEFAGKVCTGREVLAGNSSSKILWTQSCQ